MKEVFIHYLWENRLLQRGLISTDLEPIEVLHPGFANADSGPDFLNARIKIGETIWAGNVEIHVNASDWNQHKHQDDSAYDNVILHVVLEEDRKILNAANRQIPTIEVKGLFDEELLIRYNAFISSRRWIACEKYITEIQRFTLLSWLDRMIVEKMERKVEQLKLVLEQTKYDWEETFYRRLLINLGLKVNEIAFEQLAISLPFNLLLKHADDLLQLEALLFGAAGFLNDKPDDEYEKKLSENWKFFSKKYGLTSIKMETWRFMRLRPGNFPTLRLAELAMMIHTHGRLFSKVIETTDAESIIKIFRTGTSDYWKTHYRFGNPTKAKVKTLGAEAAKLLVLNSVVQLLFLYGKHTGKESLSDKAIMLLEAMEAEDNQVIRRFESLGIHAANALQSQALLFMKKEYCDQKRCLECRIGNILMDRNANR